MVPGFAASATLLGLLTLIGVNLQDMVTGIRARRGRTSGAEVPRSSGLWASLTAIGTISFLVKAIFHGFLWLLGYSDPV
ncbi:hypothetical protein A3K81_05395 [Candidatus Bathyarchaeota archaeon RBG_13_60_20]|jgi:hypothetical protein|nr:MAG: hypothetical protein A3K81_05395 [Candidatus Bathyarchaeota archaeon RBG_13_60_20]